MVSHINTVSQSMDPVQHRASTLKDPQKLLIGGTFLALYLRPLFGLSVPKSNDSVC